MYIITKDFHFSAGHVIDGLPEDHKCARLHGHNYIVRLELRSDELDSDGFVVDYAALDRVKDWIDHKMDHRHLNDALEMGHATTAEYLAFYIFKVWEDTLPWLVAVSVSETPKTWARYERGNGR